MNHECSGPAELAALLDLPADDPQRCAAHDCARCDALLRAMDAFLEGDPSVPAAEAAAAEARLAGTLAGLVGQPAPAGGRTKTVHLRLRQRQRGRSGWGWGLGLAAVLTGIVILGTRPAWLPGEGSIGPNGVLRGGEPVAGAPVDMAVTVVSSGEGELAVSWPAVPGADHYQLELFTTALDTLAVLGPLPEPAATIAADLVAGHSGPEGIGILCRVRASGPAGQVAVSRLAGLRKP
jgi:hypothetical protein